MKEKTNQEIWENEQRKLLALSTKSNQVYAYGSGHYIQKDQPELIVNVIYTLIKNMQSAY